MRLKENGILHPQLSDDASLFLDPPLSRNHHMISPIHARETLPSLHPILQPHPLKSLNKGLLP